MQSRKCIVLSNFLVPTPDFFMNSAYIPTLNYLWQRDVYTFRSHFHPLSDLVDFKLGFSF